jgi:alkylated DNA repair dioxygenase AlkB
MDSYVSRKRRRSSAGPQERPLISPSTEPEDEESTDVKLAILSSLHSDHSQGDLLEILLSCEGSVERALELLSSKEKASDPPPHKKAAIGVQSALSFGQKPATNGPSSLPLTKKGRTLHLFRPEDIAAHTPCSIVHNFLPSHLANALLAELLPEVPSYTSATFRLFDNVVKSPHTASFYVDPSMLAEQRHTYLYNGSYLSDVRELLPVMRQVSSLVRKTVNDEIQLRIKSHYPNQRKLRYQSPRTWEPNAAFVNCYDGPAQSVGYHSDQLSYLGPRAVIGSLSLGVAREFRVRKIVPPDSPPESPSYGPTTTASRNQADQQGQIAIHLPHNSLLVMHAEMQEEWKHSIAPAQSIDPHPVAGNKRINITYRWYRENFHPKNTPRCKCGTPTVLKCVQKRKETRGKYMWMCQVGSRAGGDKSNQNGPSDELQGCGYFEWADFTDDGDPIWRHHDFSSGQRDDKAQEEKPNLIAQTPPDEDTQSTSMI